MSPGPFCRGAHRCRQEDSNRGGERFLIEDSAKHIKIRDLKSRGSGDKRMNRTRAHLSSVREWSALPGGTVL